MDVERLARDILALWDEWEEEAGQDAAVMQNPEAYDATMILRISECVRESLAERGEE